jgi:hypothetical protein
MKKILILLLDVILLSSCYQQKTFYDLSLQEQCIYRARWDFDKCNKWWNTMNQTINMNGNNCLIAFNTAENNCKNVYKNNNEMDV